LETFAEPKELIPNKHYQEQRQRALDKLSADKIDAPITSLITGLNKLPFCFTLQSCYGHFLYKGQRDPHNLDPLPDTETITSVDYRIAYIAFVIEYSESGSRLMQDLKEITTISPDNIQFCSAEWFWKRQVNSYALQVEPDRFKDQDRAILSYREALQIEKIRNRFFLQLEEILQIQSG
jgi:hypothetical protein